MKSIKQLLNNKESDLLTIHPDNTVYDAVKSMADHHVGSLVVMDSGKLVGIITERDYSRNIILKGKSSKDTPIKDIMTRNVLCVTPSKTVDEAMALMTDKHVRHLPVVEDNTVIGIISIGDLVKAIISEQKHIIKQLEHYINGYG